MGSTEATFIAEFIVLILVGRVFGEVMQRFGQPAITGQLIAGIVLGPSVFGAILPELQKTIFPAVPEQRAMIDAVSQLGILLLLLLAGMETDLRLVRKVGLAAAAVSVTGILVPFICGFELGQFLPDSILPAGPRLISSLFLGTALSISSVKIVALVVREMNFVRRDLGQVIIASAIIEDTVGWVIIAVTFGIAGHGSLDLWALGRSVVGIAAFLFISFTIGRRIVFGLIRWANDSFRSEFPVITMILIIMGVMSEITQFLGVHTVLGAFVAGILIGESPILTQHVEDQLRGLVAAFFMPIFFGLAGLNADLRILKDPHLALLAAGFILIASLGKFAGAFLGGTIGRLTFRQSVAVGAAMNARGSTEIIVASIGLSTGVLTQNLFTMIVTMAIFTTTAMPPMLRRALANLPMGADEKKRIDHEALDEKSFVTNLERILLAVDDSRLGKFTARIAGLIAGAHGIPLTIVRLDGDSAAVETPDGPSKQVKEGAKTSATVMKKDASEPNPEKVHLITRSVTNEAEGAIVEEARKGFDLMMVGVAETHDAEGAFEPKITKLIKEFQGDVAIMASRGVGRVQNLGQDLRILVPINGSPIARRAAEIAIAIARPTRAHVTALYVSSNGQKRRGRIAARSHEEGALREIAELGERYEVQVLTALETKSSADKAILNRATKGYGLIVMGASQRPGDEVFFGNTANAILKKWKGAVLLVAT